MQRRNRGIENFDERIGQSNDRDGDVGRYYEAMKNCNGKWSDCYNENNLIVANTFFKHKDFC